MTCKDFKYDIELSNILFGLMDKNKSYQDNYFNYLMLKHKYSEVFFNYKDFNKIESIMRRSGKYQFSCDITYFEGNYIFKCNNISVQNDILNNILHEHAEVHINKECFQHDAVIDFNIPVYGKTRIRSTSCRNGNGFELSLRYLHTSSEYIIRKYSTIIINLLADFEYIKKLSENELHVINEIYYMITEDRIDFNKESFFNYIALLEIIDS